MKTHFTKPLWCAVSMFLCLILVGLVTAGCEDTKHYTVNFIGEEVSVESQSIEHGMRATKPENPERENYGFGGWFTDNRTFANEWNFKTDIVTRDTTLYAKWEENILPNYPIDIPFTEYLLAGTFCQWINLNYDDKIIVINSNEQLASYINCQEENYPEINFSKYTLLLAHGKAPSSIVNVNCSSLQQYSEQNYKMEVEVAVGDATVLSNWQIPVIIGKLDEKSIIELIITIKYSEL